MPTLSFFRRTAPAVGAILLASCATMPAWAQADAPVDALIYSTMPSTRAHSPLMAMDGDPKTYFQTVYGMSDSDDVRFILSRPTVVSNVTIVTGDDKEQDAVTNGFVETSPDGVKFTKAANFDAKGVAQVTGLTAPLKAFRIKINPGRSASTLIIREVTVTAATPVTRALYGPGRGLARPVAGAQSGLARAESLVGTGRAQNGKLLGRMRRVVVFAQFHLAQRSQRDLQNRPRRDWRRGGGRRRDHRQHRLDGRASRRYRPHGSRDVARYPGV